MSDKFIACGLTLDEITMLADKVENGSLSKIKLKNNDGEIVIEKESKAVVSPIAPVMNMVSQEANSAVSEKKAEPAESKPEGNIVKAPIVGTFYSAPAPDKAPFVTVGQQVKKGDTIMIIESMKLMNEVQSDFDGIVKEILVENGTPVEFDQPIMIIG